jgi:hypothetical protein
MRSIAIAAALGALAFSAAGCLTAGPCVHVFRDALVHVDAVVDDPFGSGIDSVFVTNVTINDDSFPLFLALEGGGHQTHVALVADTMRCGVPCSFGSEEGRWKIMLVARGYASQTVTFDAHYAKFHGGCPSYDDGGTHVVLHLSRRVVAPMHS